MNRPAFGLGQDKARRNASRRFCWILAVALWRAAASDGLADDPQLIAHWKLRSDARDCSDNGLHARNHGVRFSEGVGVFNGTDAYLEVEDNENLRPGTGDFTIALWVHTADRLTDVLGDLVSKFDPRTRTGAILSLMNYPGVTNVQSNLRNLFFGIDANSPTGPWEDLERPGDSRHVRSLCVHDGNLYASTWEPEAGDSGGIYRFEGPENWVHVGSPDKANAISSLCVCNAGVLSDTAIAQLAR